MSQRHLVTPDILLHYVLSSTTSLGSVKPSWVTSSTLSIASYRVPPRLVLSSPAGSSRSLCPLRPIEYHLAWFCQAQLGHLVHSDHYVLSSTTSLGSVKPSWVISFTLSITSYRVPHRLILSSPAGSSRSLCPLRPIEYHLAWFCQAQLGHLVHSVHYVLSSTTSLGSVKPSWVISFTLSITSYRVPPRLVLSSPAGSSRSLCPLRPIEYHLAWFCQAQLGHLMIHSVHQSGTQALLFSLSGLLCFVKLGELICSFLSPSYFVCTHIDVWRAVI